eukprot:GHRQ01018261.1.p1 GENE.GHRQ01018261.1~~GHRQ01018261.1.p1  ORF type:complete len:198 (+),score=87.66 GHRQ01018261.1:436-1029(+)
MTESIANRDAAFECLDIAKAALRAGDHARAEKFSQKAIKLYRCQETEKMLLQVQVFISELTRSSNGPSAANGRSERSSSHDQQQPHKQHQHRNHTGSQQQHYEQQQTRHAQQQHSGSSNQQQQQPRGMGGSDGLRHRQQQQPRQRVQEDPSVTPEQRQVVQQILAAKGFYDVLGIPKDAAEADIKQAYRKVCRLQCA